MNKILIVSVEFPPQPGGIGNHAYNLAKQLTVRGKQVSVLTNTRSKDGYIEREFDQIQEFRIIRIQRKTPVFITYWKRYTMFKKIIKLEKPEFVLASGKFSLWLIAFNKYKIIKLAVVHGSELNLPSSWQKRLVNSALKRMNTIIAVSNFTHKLLESLSLANTVVIPNGFDSENFELQLGNDETNKKSPVLITVGALSLRKGQHNVLNALPILRKRFPNIHYHIVGIPTEKKQLQQLVHNLKIEELVSFHGVLDQHDLVYLLTKSDIFVMLSESTTKGDVEGFGIALLEANYIGTPTIGSLNCGIEDAILNHKSGILIENKNVNEFLIAIEEIMENNEYYVNNAKNWSNKHKWEIVIQRYLKYLE